MPVAAGGVVSPVFVGRATELAMARSLVDRALAGDSSILLLAGEAGVGKTRLAEETARYARARGMQVLAGHCVQLGTDGLPFAPIAEALRELIRDTGREREGSRKPALGLIRRKRE